MITFSLQVIPLVVGQMPKENQSVEIWPIETSMGPNQVESALNIPAEECNYAWANNFTQQNNLVRARLDCLTKPSDVMHLTKSGWPKLQKIDKFTK